MAKGKKTGGRVKGSQNKVGMRAAAIFAEQGWNPLEALIAFARADLKKLRMKLGDVQRRGSGHDGSL